MTVIAAAPTQALQSELVARLLEAGEAVSDTVASPVALDRVLLARREGLVVLAGGWSRVGALLRAARAHEAMTLWLAPEAASSGPAFDAGARGVLDSGITHQALRAAIDSVRAGLIIAGVHRPGASRPPAPRASRALSPREREILGQIAAGASNKAIARALSLSPNTIKFHLAAAFAKLGVASRAEAVAVAARRGELSL